MFPLGLIAREKIGAFANTLIQLSPLLSDRKTPISVPAKISPMELTASARPVEAVKPESIFVQLSPLLVERKTELPKVPAKISPFRFIARESIFSQFY